MLNGQRSDGKTRNILSIVADLAIVIHTAVYLISKIT